MNEMSTMNKIMEVHGAGKPIVHLTSLKDECRRNRLSLRPQDRHGRFRDKILELIDDPNRCREMGMYDASAYATNCRWSMKSRN